MSFTIVCTWVHYKDIVAMIRNTFIAQAMHHLLTKPQNTCRGSMMCVRTIYFSESLKENSCKRLAQIKT